MSPRPAPWRTEPPSGRVFPRFSVDGAEKAMRAACKTAGIPHFTPHQFRHRRGTRWHHDNVPAKVAAERLGHSDPSLTLSLYSHVLDPGEVSRESLEALLVWSPCGTEEHKSVQTALLSQPPTRRIQSGRPWRKMGRGATRSPS